MTTVAVVGGGDHRAGRGPAAGRGRPRGRRAGGRAAAGAASWRRSSWTACGWTAGRSRCWPGGRRRRRWSRTSGSGRAAGASDRRPARRCWSAGRCTRCRPRCWACRPTSSELRGLLSRAGYARAAREPDRPAPPLGPATSPSGRVVDERFGAGGDRPAAGAAARRGVRRATPASCPSPRWPRTCSRGRRPAARCSSTPGPRPRRAGGGPVFAGLAGGLSTLVDGAGRRTWSARGVELRTGATVRALDRDGGRFRLTAGPVPAPETIIADGGAARRAGGAGRPAAGRTGRTAPELAGGRRTPRSRWSPWWCAGWAERGSGLLVPPGELPTIKALTYSATKWAWVAEARGRDLGRGRRGGPGQCRPGRGERRAAGGRPGAGGAHLRRGAGPSRAGTGPSWSPAR